MVESFNGGMVTWGTAKMHKMNNEIINEVKHNKQKQTFGLVILRQDIFHLSIIPAMQST